MKSMKRGLAWLMAVLLFVPNIPVQAVKTDVTAPGEAEVVSFNTGNHTFSVGSKMEEEADGSVSAGDSVSGNTLSGNSAGAVQTPGNDTPDTDFVFDENGDYTIQIPELNPFFPYEVQFTCDGEVSREWFMTPEDSVEIGGHTFYVDAHFDNTTVTSLSLNVAGKTVVVYPEAKEFTNEEAGISPFSFFPLTEQYLTVDLRGFTPVELTQVSVASIFTGENALTDLDKVAWTTYYDDDFVVVPASGNMDFSVDTYYDSTSRWELIVGSADPLDPGNMRYFVTASLTPAKEWLLADVYLQDTAGNRVEVTQKVVEYRDYDRDDRNLSIDIPEVEEEYQNQGYVNLRVNPQVFAAPQYASVKFYEGNFATAEEAMAGMDITAQITGADLSQPNAGYLIRIFQECWITMVSFDAAGNATGCLPFEMDLYDRDDRLSTSLYKVDDNGNVTSEMVNASRSSGRDGWKWTEQIYELYQGYAANDLYTIRFYYDTWEGSTDNSLITAAYIGEFASIAEATAAQAADIKDVLFTSNYGEGYEADYSQGIIFTIFVGEDGDPEQKIYKYSVKTLESNVPKPLSGPSSGVSVYFNGLVDADGNYVDSYQVDSSEDSYGEFNYLTLLVEEDVDLSKLAPQFSLAHNAKLYAAGSSTPEVSGKSYHDFSKGAIQYTVSAEDGENSKNYWLRILKPAEGAGPLYVNSMEDVSANTRTENGVVYSTREMMLDGYHEYVHDILFINTGRAAITNLKAELVSDVIELDDYWMFSGSYELPGFSDLYSGSNGLVNFGKLRMRAKEGVETGTDISGTLTIKSGDTTLMVLKLTGIIGDPGIITDTIPGAVKYVPYGTMIQNNNKYSWNRVSYEWLGGNLPLGMEVKPNGEIYGVPLETGDFTFTVRMDNSSNEFADDKQTYTLTVVENTDANVEAATDTGYDLTERIQTIYLGNGSGSNSLVPEQTMVSQGEYDEFVDVYLDGAKLQEGVDYTSESGSTRITILTNTLLSARDTSGKSHTLALEFRTRDNDFLKRAAQNYVIEDGNTPSGGNGGGQGGGNGGQGNGGNQGSGAYQSQSTAAGQKVETVTYTIQSGDTLWKIAKKFYGSGEYWKKVYEDNADVIRNPDRIYAGQVIIIYLSGEASADTQNTVVDGKSYTVQPGDTLWKIAKAMYGQGWHWRRIYAANEATISSPERVYVGQVLVIPK